MKRWRVMFHDNINHEVMSMVTVMANTMEQTGDSCFTADCVHVGCAGDIDSISLDSDRSILTSETP